MHVRTLAVPTPLLRCAPVLLAALIAASSDVALASGSFATGTLALRIVKPEPLPPMPPLLMRSTSHAQPLCLPLPPDAASAARVHVRVNSRLAAVASQPACPRGTQAIRLTSPPIDGAWRLTLQPL